MVWRTGQSVDMKNDGRFESCPRGSDYQQDYNQRHALSQWNSAGGKVVAGPLGGP